MCEFLTLSVAVTICNVQRTQFIARIYSVRTLLKLMLSLNIYTFGNCKHNNNVMNRIHKSSHNGSRNICGYMSVTLSQLGHMSTAETHAFVEGDLRLCVGGLPGIFLFLYR